MKSLQGWKTVLVVFLTLLIVCETLAYVVNTPRPSEQFFQLYLLGSNHMAADYYPNNSTDLPLGTRVTWSVGVTDNMGSVQLVSVRVKLGNQSISPPEDQNALPSPSPVVTDFGRVLQNNETWEFPFVWSISNATLSGNSTRILTVQINDETYQFSDWSASYGYNFRLIFELWTWQEDANSFEFGWVTSGNERHVAWLQVWFNMTTPEFI